MSDIKYVFTVSKDWKRTQTFNNRPLVKYIQNIYSIEYYLVFKIMYQRMIMTICSENVTFLKVNNVYKVILKKFFLTYGKNT